MSLESFLKIHRELNEASSYSISICCIPFQIIDLLDIHSIYPFRISDCISLSILAQSSDSFCQLILSCIINSLNHSETDPSNAIIDSFTTNYWKKMDARVEVNMFVLRSYGWRVASSHTLLSLIC